MTLPNLLLLIAPGCSPEPGEQPVVEARSYVPPAPVLRASPPIEILLDPPPAGLGFRWDAEVAGLATLLVEAGLGELYGVLVTVAGRPPSPGAWQPAGLGHAERWSARILLGENPSALEVELELCALDSSAESEDRACRSTSVTASRESVESAMPRLLTFASEVLDRAPAPGAEGQWGLPLSQDPYAVLMAGRAAASWYGILPAPTPEQEGDAKRDPLLRAVLIDPGIALTQWLIGRRFAVKGQWEDARVAFTAARAGRPFHPVLLADEAHATGGEGRRSAAAGAWDGILEVVPNDPRFSLAQFHAALAARHIDDARRLLERLYGDWPDDPGVAAARVALADAAGDEQDTDALLAHWQDTDRTAVEPVRRRVQLRVRRAGYRDAWALLPELRTRGADDLADAFEVPLGVAIGQWNAAALAAERSGQPDTARRIRARGALEQEAGRVPDTLLNDRSQEATLVLGWADLRAGQAVIALERAQGALRTRPWDPGALALAQAANEELGRGKEAAALAQRIAAVEPAPPRVMVPPPASR